MWSFVKLMIWGLIWLPAWAITTIYRLTTGKPRIDNCLTWSLRRWNTDGGYLVIRWCRSNRITFVKWPHFMWLPATQHSELRHFVPKKMDQSYRFVPDIFFEGKVVKGDDEDDNLEN